MENAPEVSVIIPCLDEAACAASYGDALLAPLAEALPSHEVIFSDGGSADGTLDLLWRLAVAAARGRYILFMEADLSFDPADARRLLEAAKSTGADCVCGSPFLGRFSNLPLPRRLHLRVDRVRTTSPSRRPTPRRS